MGELPNCVCPDADGHRVSHAVGVRPGKVDVLHQCVVCGATRTEVVDIAETAALPPMPEPDVELVDEPTETE